MGDFGYIPGDAAFHDIHFFEKYTKESCYWAGFIAADGNISIKEDSVNIHLE